jgi:hypothetical protein
MPGKQGLLKNLWVKYPVTGVELFAREELFCGWCLVGAGAFEASHEFNIHIQCDIVR